MLDEKGRSVRWHNDYSWFYNGAPAPDPEAIDNLSLLRTIRN
jgi:hypothetical protein